jgi:hypothetical protein
MCPVGLARSATHRVGMKCLGIRMALPGGRTECVPPRKSPFALFPGSPRKAIRHWLAHPSEGRAPHARKEGITQTTTLPRFGHEPFADPEVAMTCPGFGPARICGRTECVPPRKPPFASSPGFPSKAFHPGQAHLEGRAPHARNEGTGFTEAYPARPRPLGYASGRNEMPRHSYGRTVRTRRPRPSEKTAFRVIPGFPPQGLSLGPGPPGGAGSARPQGMPRFSPGISTYWPRPMTTVRAKPNFLGTRRA